MIDDQPLTGDLLALYGTLMTGLGAQERLGVTHQLESVGPCVLAGSLVELGWYPGLVEDPTRRVRGELFRVIDLAVLDVLDRYEGYDPVDPAGSEYLRLRVTTIEPVVEAWVYRFTGTFDPARCIAGGDWRAHVEGQVR